MKTYYKKHREECKANSRLYYAKNRDKICQKSRDKYKSLTKEQKQAKLQRRNKLRYRKHISEMKKEIEKLSKALKYACEDKFIASIEGNCDLEYKNKVVAEFVNYYKDKV